MAKKALDNWYQITNQTDVPELLIYGYIGEWDEVDFVRFQAAIKELAKTNNRVTVRIHSGGGSVIDGLPIYDCLVTSGMERDVIIDGMAASMASVLSQSASKGRRLMHENGTIMIHRVKGGTYGNSDDLRAYADLVEDREKRIKQIFVKNTGQDAATVDVWFAKNTDWWINAEQALELGLIDEILKGDTDAPGLPFNKLQKMGEKNAHEALKNAFTISNLDKNMNKIQIFVMAALAARGINVAENATEDQVAAHLTRALKDADDLLADLKNKLSLKDKERADSLVATAKAGGKLKEDDTEGAKDIHDLALVNYALAARTVDKMQGAAAPAPKNVIVNIGTGDSGKKTENDPENRNNWTFGDYRQKDPKGLENMYQSDNEQWQKLYNAEYKK